ncbi:MAG: hypothetical protein M3352_05910 [Bacteroidota bacterium]|nr:hypothetical protein [Bacteroidota bacterium]
MRWLLFLSRIAFICNLFFLLTVLLQWRNLGGNDAVISTIIIIGYVFAILVNPLVNIFYVFMLIRKKPLLQRLPKWLVLANFIFLLLQLQYLLFLNDTFHY